MVDAGESVCPAMERRRSGVRTVSPLPKRRRLSSIADNGVADRNCGSGICSGLFIVVGGNVVKLR